MSNGIAATETALSSSGSAMRENSKYLDSINGRMAVLGASFERLSKTFINSDFIKFLIEIATAVIDVVNNLGLLNTSLIALLIFLGVKGQLTVILTSLPTMFLRLATSIGVANTAMGALATTLSVAIPITIIALLIKQVYDLSDANKSFIQTQTQISDTADENISKYEQEITTLKSLEKALMSAKGDKESLLSVSSQLNDVIGETPGLITGEADAYYLAKQKLVDYRIEAEKNLKLAKDSKIAAQRNIFNSNSLDNIFTLHGLGISAGASIDVSEAAMNVNRDDISNELKNKLQKFLNEQVSLAQGYFADYLNQSLPDVASRAAANSFIESLIFGGEGDIDEINKKIEKFIPSLAEINDLKNELSKAKLDGSPTEEIVTRFIELINKLKTDFPYLNKYFDSFTNSFTDVAEGARVSTVEIIDYTDVSNKAKESLDNLAKSTDIVNSAFKEQATNGSLTMKTMLDLIDAGYASALMIDQETGLVKLNAEAYKELTKAKIEAQLATLKLAEADLDTIVSGQKSVSSYMAMSGSDVSKLFPDLSTNEEQLKILRTQIAAYEEVKNNFDKITSGTYGDKPEKASKEDLYKKDVESKISDLQYLHNMGKISEAEYLNELDTLNKKYYKNLAKYKEESRRLDVEVYKGKNQLADQAAKDDEKRAEEAKKQAEEVLKIQQDAIQHRIDYAKQLYSVHQDENKYVSDLEKLLKYINISDEQRLAILKEIADVRKNEYKDTLTDIEHENFLLEKKSSTEQQRIENLRRMQSVVHEEAEKLRAAGYDNASSEIQELQTLWYKYEDSIQDILENLNETITNNLKKTLESQADLISNHIDDLQTQQSNLEGALSYVTDTIDREIESLRAQRDALDDSNSAIERQIELQKLIENLENARRNKNVRVYYSDRSFVWESDQRVVSEAQSALDTWNRQDKLRREQQAIDDAIRKWEEYRKSFTDVSKNVQAESDKLAAVQIFGRDIEASILAQRTSAIDTFTANYIANINAIKTAQEELNDIQSQIANVDSGGSSIGGSGKIAPIAYNPDIDYQAEINKVLKKMADASPEEKKTSAYYNNMEELIRLETLRNSKIKQEKLPYEQTSLYGGQTFANGSDSVPQTGVSLVGENGAEYRILNKGDGILSANVTRTLKSFGSNPLQFITSRIPQISSLINNKTTSSQTHYHFGDVVLPNANDFPSFVSGLQLYVDTHKA